MKANYGNNYSTRKRMTIEDKEKLRDIMHAYLHDPELFRRIVEGKEVEVNNSDYPELCSEGLGVKTNE